MARNNGWLITIRKNIIIRVNNLTRGITWMVALKTFFQASSTSGEYPVPRQKLKALMKISPTMGY